jgi:hypothetical protein
MGSHCCNKKCNIYLSEEVNFLIVKVQKNNESWLIFDPFMLHASFVMDLVSQQLKAYKIISHTSIIHAHAPLSQKIPARVHLQKILI